MLLLINHPDAMTFPSWFILAGGACIIVLAVIFLAYRKR